MNPATQGRPAPQACWDADRLDLWRVGIQPQLRYLSTPYARKPSTQKRANQMAVARPSQSTQYQEIKFGSGGW